jgi:hypothetical protein
MGWAASKRSINVLDPKQAFSNAVSRLDFSISEKVSDELVHPLIRNRTSFGCFGVFRSTCLANNANNVTSFINFHLRKIIFGVELTTIFGVVLSSRDLSKVDENTVLTAEGLRAVRTKPSNVFGIPLLRIIHLYLTFTDCREIIEIDLFR